MFQVYKTDRAISTLPPLFAANEYTFVGFAYYCDNIFYANEGSAKTLTVSSRIRLNTIHVNATLEIDYKLDSDVKQIYIGSYITKE